MNKQGLINYERVEKAIIFLNENFKNQPSLDEVAEAVQLSPFHFQRLFTQWAGVSPKKFLQYLSINHAKNLLENNKSTLDAAYETGLSGTSRLHDLFVSIEAMTPGEYKNGGEGLLINYSFTESPFGSLLVASTQKGICQMFFDNDEKYALETLMSRFPKAKYQRELDQFQKNALQIFQNDWSDLKNIKVHLAGTSFQIKVWESLLKIPLGGLKTYGSLAKDIGQPRSSRAVGTAIGKNPIAYLIPCHRVIQSSGKTGGYMWGESRKLAIIGWESAKLEREDKRT